MAGTIKWHGVVRMEEIKSKWKCSSCNYIFEGDKPPEICPVCHKKAEFEILREEDFSDTDMD
jgi:rubrerythrin